MDILIVNHNMEAFFGGTETWTMTMVHAFRQLGHTTHFTGNSGKINKNFEQYYQLLKKSYDIVIINGKKNVSKFATLGKKSIFVSHGILPEEEKPVRGTDLILAVSEETKKNVENHGFICNGIIRNPINTDHFSKTNINDNPLTVAIVDRRRRFKFINQLKEKYSVIEIGHPPIFDIKNAILKSDIVIGKGRVIYEAMSMGKNVVVSGNNSGTANTEIMDGFVDNKTFFMFRQNNCSGRYNSKQVNTFVEFDNEIKKYSKNQGNTNRNMIIDNNNYLKIANQILNIANT